MFYLRQYDSKNHDRATCTICLKKWTDVVATIKVWKSLGYYVELKNDSDWVGV